MKIETRKLEFGHEDKGLKKVLRSKQLRRTLAGIFIGAAAGFAFFYLTEGMHMDSLSTTDILQSLAFGGLFGLFVTNSPCARNSC
jgi:peptidoglycan/LPS O-acetylase OafA/YrhL